MAMIRTFPWVGVHALACASLFLAACSAPARTPATIAPPLPEARLLVATPPRVTKIGMLGDCVIYTNNLLHFCGTNCPVPPLTNFTFLFYQNPIPATSPTQVLAKTLKGTTNFRDWYLVASNVTWRSIVVVPNNKPCEFFRLE
jgi:hypothetical protein